MKTAEEWTQFAANARTECAVKERLGVRFDEAAWIHAIQLDAFKAGMTRAAALCESTGDNVSNKPELTDAESEYQNGAYTCQRIIQQTRDTLTKLPKD